jgi:signal transduction histidine kinase
VAPLLLEPRGLDGSLLAGLAERVGCSPTLKNLEESERTMQIVPTDHPELDLHASGAPLRGRKGHSVGTVQVTRDVAYRKRLEREREEARAHELVWREAAQHMDEFLAMASHDLRSPLTVALTAADLAITRFNLLAETVTARAPDLNEEVAAVRTCMEELSHSVDRLSRLATVLFDTSQVRAAKLVLQCQPCELGALVREQVEAQRLANPDHAIHLEAPADEPLLVLADAERIGQVVTNYLTNALKYSPANQPIHVHMIVDSQAARVEVRDRGPGLPAREHDRIWQRFYRAKGIRVQKEWSGGGGLGMGLHISKAIVEQHGGEVGVKSAVGHGSTFWFTVPLHDVTGA